MNTFLSQWSSEYYNLVLNWKVIIHTKTFAERTDIFLKLKLVSVHSVTFNENEKKTCLIVINYVFYVHADVR